MLYLTFYDNSNMTKGIKVISNDIKNYHSSKAIKVIAKGLS
jgi:hypothetical protein